MTWDDFITYADWYGILLGDVMLTLSAAGAVVAWTKRDKLLALFRKNRFPEVGTMVDDNTRFDAVIFTVSRPEVPAWVMQRFKTRMVGLVYTDYSEAAADEIEDEADRKGIKVLRQKVENSDDPQDCKIAVNLLIKKASELGALSQAVDVTGGKVPMSLGAFMAAEENRMPTLYVSARYEDNKAVPASIKPCYMSEPKG